jgi:hypothetical protein
MLSSLNSGLQLQPMRVRTPCIFSLSPYLWNKTKVWRTKRCRRTKQQVGGIFQLLSFWIADISKHLQVTSITFCLHFLTYTEEFFKVIQHTVEFFNTFQQVYRNCPMCFFTQIEIVQHFPKCIEDLLMSSYTSWAIFHHFPAYICIGISTVFLRVGRNFLTVPHNT